MDKPKQPCGFALLSPEKRKELARKGGVSVAPEKRSFSKNRALAAAAGAKGGHAVRPEARIFSQNRELASSAGRKGAQSATKNASDSHEN